MNATEILPVYEEAEYEDRSKIGSTKTQNPAQSKPAEMHLSEENMRQLARIQIEENAKYDAQNWEIEESQTKAQEKAILNTAIKIENLEKSIQTTFGVRPATSGVAALKGDCLNEAYSLLLKNIADYTNTTDIVIQLQNSCGTIFTLSNFASGGKKNEKVCDLAVIIPDPISSYLLSPTLNNYFRQQPQPVQQSRQHFRRQGGVYFEPQPAKAVTRHFLDKVSKDRAGQTLKPLSTPNTIELLQSMISEVLSANNVYFADLLQKAVSHLDAGELDIFTTTSAQNDKISQEFYKNQIALMKTSLVNDVERYKNKFTSSFEAINKDLNVCVSRLEQGGNIQYQINDLVAPNRFGIKKWQQNFNYDFVKKMSNEPLLDIGHFYFLEVLNSALEPYKGKDYFDLILIPDYLPADSAHDFSAWQSSLISMFQNIPGRAPVELVFQKNFGRGEGAAIVESGWFLVAKSQREISPSVIRAQSSLLVTLLRILIDYAQGEPLADYPLLKADALFSSNLIKSYIQISPTRIYVSETNTEDGIVHGNGMYPLAAKSYLTVKV